MSMLYPKIQGQAPACSLAFKTLQGFPQCPAMNPAARKGGRASLPYHHPKARPMHRRAAMGEHRINKPCMDPPASGII